MDSKKREYLIRVFGEKLADEIVDAAEGKTAALERAGIKFKELSSSSAFSFADAEEASRIADLCEALLTIVVNIRFSDLSPSDQRQKLVAASDEFSRRLQEGSSGAKTAGALAYVEDLRTPPDTAFSATRRPRTAAEDESLASVPAAVYVADLIGARP